MTCCIVCTFAQEFKASAEQGDAAAQTKMGDYHFERKEYTQALQWYEKAAQQDNVDAILQLIEIYENGYGVTKDEKKGVMYEKKAAGLGSAKAQYYLGNTYHNGYGGEAKNLSKAVEWYRKAAEQGYAKAQDMLGDCYYEGDGVTKDYAKAVEWYRKAAEQGYKYAQKSLGSCYYFGRGVTKDYAMAVEWYRKAAEQGYANAQDLLGDCYYDGDGVTKDYAKAVEWYRKAAEQGYKYAQKSLGRCYYYGNGVTEDSNKALEWFNKAQKNGENCCFWIGKCYQQLKNYTKAMEYFRKGEAEDKYCSLALGWMYYEGEGVQKSLTKAKEYAQKAGDAGQNLLEEIENENNKKAKYNEMVRKWGKASVDAWLQSKVCVGMSVKFLAEMNDVEIYKLRVYNGGSDGEFKVEIACMNSNGIWKNKYRIWVSNYKITRFKDWSREDDREFGL